MRDDPPGQPPGHRRQRPACQVWRLSNRHGVTSDPAPAMARPRPRRCGFVSGVSGCALLAQRASRARAGLAGGA